MSPIERWRRGRLGGRDRAEAERLIASEYQRTYAYLCYRTDPETAADLCQETFRAAWSGIDSLRSERYVGSWLRKIAHHVYLRAGRRRGHRVVPLQEGLEATDPSPGPLERVIDDDRRSRLLEGLRRLDPDVRDVIELVYLQGNRMREAAGILNIPLGTVQSRSNRGLTQLRDFLKHEEEFHAKPRDSKTRTGTARPR